MIHSCSAEDLPRALQTIADKGLTGTFEVHAYYPGICLRGWAFDRINLVPEGEVWSGGEDAAAPAALLQMLASAMGPVPQDLSSAAVVARKEKMMVPFTFKMRDVDCKNLQEVALRRDNRVKSSK